MTGLRDARRKPANLPSDWKPSKSVLETETARLRTLGYIDGDIHGLVSRTHRDALSLLGSVAGVPLEGLAQGARLAQLCPANRKKCRDFDAINARPL